ncbi:MAG: aminotransferase class I/II-fold pyridoxal phosphate-dependent enzyme [bacterium]|nr:aminotransferase class I/II-fold pyridoxal phosphate-dependent enzyme [bacterium]
MNIVFTDSGRSAFQIAIKELGLENSEMLVPAYICDIFLPIFAQYNIKPIFLDIDLKTFHADIPEIEKKITPRTKSILICHTYGLPASINEILDIAKRHNLKIIEDCAHLPLFGLPRETYSKLSRTKSRGDCAFFSFAKICPNINGGMLVSKTRIKTEISDYKPKLSNIIKFLRLFPVLANVSENFRKEKPQTTENFREPRKASKLSLNLFNDYLENFAQQIEKRIELVKYFQKKLQEIGFEVQKPENNIFTYISALVPQNVDRDKLFDRLKKYNIFCSRIWRKPIYIDLPNTRETAQRIINFPLQDWFTEKDIDEMIKCLKCSIASLV